MRISSRVYLELKRQLFHLAMGMCIATGVFYLMPLVGLWILLPLILAIIIMITIGALAIKHKIVDFLMFHFERDKEIREFPFRGAIWYGIGIIFPIALMPTNVACAIIAVLSIGDSVSTVIGKTCGKIKIGMRTLEGSLAFLAFGFFGALIFVNMQTALALAITGAVVELVSPWDDNLMIPLVLSLAYALVNLV